MRQEKHVIIMLEVGGNAFQANENREVARILRLLAAQFSYGAVTPGMKLHDTEGYPCGEVKILLTESPS